MTRNSPPFETVPINAKDDCVASVAQPRRILRHGIQDWLHVRRRGSDDSEHFAGRRLLLQCFSEVAVPCFKFPE